MELDRAAIIEAGAHLAVSSRRLQDQLDRLIELHPDDEEYRKMRDFLEERQGTLYDLLLLIPE